MSPCLCGDAFCPSCGGGCIECDNNGKEECGCPSMWDDDEAIQKLYQMACEHLDYTDTLTGAVCNDCGKEELIE